MIPVPPKPRLSGQEYLATYRRLQEFAIAEDDGPLDSWLSEKMPTSAENGLRQIFKGVYSEGDTPLELELTATSSDAVALKTVSGERGNLTRGVLFRRAGQFFAGICLRQKSRR